MMRSFAVYAGVLFAFHGPLLWLATGKAVSVAAGLLCCLLAAGLQVWLDRIGRGCGTEGQPGQE